MFMCEQILNNHNIPTNIRRILADNPKILCSTISKKILQILEAILMSKKKEKKNNKQTLPT